jgi:peroxiredoxin
MTISMDDLSYAGRAVEHLGLQFPVLYDLEGEVVRQYQVYDLLNDGLAAPATFLLDTEGKVRWEYVAKWDSDRPTIDRILIELESIHQG